MKKLTDKQIDINRKILSSTLNRTIESYVEMSMNADVHKKDLLEIIQSALLLCQLDWPTKLGKEDGVESFIDFVKDMKKKYGKDMQKSDQK